MEAAYGVGGTGSTGAATRGPAPRPTPVSCGPRPLPWEALLDALEERTRRLALVVEHGGEDDAPEPSLLPDGPIPASLELRARVLLAETTRLTELAERRRHAAERALRYAQA